MPGSVRPCRNYVELHIILLHFPAFYDTILILRKLTAENNRWNINKIANILPMKTQRIHPHIIGFVEFEWWECRRAMWFILCRAITLSLRHRKIRPCISRCGVLFLSSGLSFPCLIQGFSEHSALYHHGVGASGPRAGVDKLLCPLQNKSHCPTTKFVVGQCDLSCLGQ